MPTYTDRDKAMPTPNTRESASAAVQAAVRAAGGLEQIVNQVHEAWGESSAPGRREDLRAQMKATLQELEVINATEPESSRAVTLRAAVERHSTELRELARDNEAFARRVAHQTIMQAMGGDPTALRTLSVHAARVNPAFANAISAAL